MIRQITIRYGTWMLLSCILFAGLGYRFINVPQKRIARELESEKERMENELLALRESSRLLLETEEAVRQAEAKIALFEWLGTENVEPNLSFYNHVHRAAEKADMDFITMISQDSREEGEDSDYIRYDWRVDVAGSFVNMLEMVADLEKEERFLMLKQIVITPGAAGQDKQHYEMLFSGIKRGD